MNKIRKSGALLVLAVAGMLAIPAVLHLAAAQEGETLSIDFELVAQGLESPVQYVDARDGSGRFFIVEQTGAIRISIGGEIRSQPFLDLTGNVSGSNEQGLLSMALHPEFRENGLFFVDYTDLDGDTQIVRYAVSADDRNLADPDSATTILTVDQPARNHNGGLLLFGPDGYLYIGLGDGGFQGDPDGHGQDLSTLLGSILRIDVTSGEEPYGIPDDNPFVDDESAAPEIWSYGLRNPWRFSFDRETGDLWIGDVGQNSLEEIDLQPAGESGLNFGWNLFEGTECYFSETCDSEGLVMPVFEYGREFGCSVIGGYVYRGQTVDAIAGRYLLADYCAGYMWAIAPDGQGGFTVTEPLATDFSITSFAEDASGELYIVDRGGGIYRIVR